MRLERACTRVHQPRRGGTFSSHLGGAGGEASSCTTQAPPRCLRRSDAMRAPLRARGAGLCEGFTAAPTRHPAGPRPELPGQPRAALSLTASSGASEHPYNGAVLKRIEMTKPSRDRRAERPKDRARRTPASPKLPLRVVVDRSTGSREVVGARAPLTAPRRGGIRAAALALAPQPPRGEAL